MTNACAVEVRTRPTRSMYPVEKDVITSKVELYAYTHFTVNLHVACTFTQPSTEIPPYNRYCFMGFRLYELHKLKPECPVFLGGDTASKGTRI